MKPSQPVALPLRPPKTLTPRHTNPAYHEKPILQRYAVCENGCWEWQGLRSGGYGRCKVDNRTVPAHRVFYEHHVGPIPDGHDIHHKCGNRGCVNPQHLEPLTRAENTRRAPHKHTVLDWEKAREIRQAMDWLCEHYGVKPRTLAAVAERRIWNDEGGDA